MKKWIDKDTVNRICEGSLENTIDKIRQSIAENADKFSNKKVKVLASFPRHAIVMNEEGNAFRVEFEGEKYGIKGIEEAKELRALSESEVSDRTVKMAREAIELLFEGKIEDSKSRVSKIAECIKGTDIVGFLKDKFLNGSSESRIFLKNLKENVFRMRARHGEVLVESGLKFSKGCSDRTIVLDECKKMVAIINEDVDKLAKDMDKFEGKSNKKVLAVSVVNEGRDIAQMACDIIKRYDGLSGEDLSAVHGKLSDYVEGIKLTIKDLGSDI